MGDSPDLMWMALGEPRVYSKSLQGERTVSPGPGQGCPWGGGQDTKTLAGAHCVTF